MIEEIQVRFEQGRIVEARATKGQEVLGKLIDTDDGARRLGEVALVPHSSPIAHSGLTFFNTLFDENAASHVALGQACSSCLRDGGALTPEQLADRGANESLIHVDWMIGSDSLDIDAITSSGAAEPPTAFIDEKIKELGDWRGKTLARVREIIHEADPEIVEEWKWMGTPVWSHGGIVCTGETYKNVVKMPGAPSTSTKATRSMRRH
jgi:hypothetical protein